MNGGGAGWGSKTVGLLLIAGTSAACSLLGGIEAIELATDRDRCALPSDCAEGDTCLYGLCAVECAADRDCDVGARCLRADGRAACVTPATAACARDEDCGEGAVCVDIEGIRECRTTCAPTSLSCLDGQACVGAFCVGSDPTRDPAASSAGGSAGAPTGGDGGTGGARRGGDGASGGGGETSTGGGGGTSTGGAMGRACARYDDCSGAQRCDFTVDVCRDRLVVLDAAPATFARPTRASVRRSSTSFDWVEADVLRREDRTDGRGPLPLLEEERCNHVPDVATGWSPTAASVTPLPTSGPGGGAALRFEATSSSNDGRVQSPAFNLPASLRGYSYSYWYRPEGTSAHTSEIQATGSTMLQADGSDGTWGRRTPGESVLLDGGGTGVVANISVRLGWPSGTVIAAAPGDAGTLSAVQLEQGAFPTSYTDQRCGTSFRPADLATLPSDPADLLTAGFRVTLFPDFDSDDLADGDAIAVVTVGEGDAFASGLRFRASAGEVRMVVSAAGAAVASTAALTFSAGDRLEVVVRPAEGTLTVDDVLVSAAPWSWTDGTIHIGHDIDGVAQAAHAYTGRLTDLFPAPMP